MHSKLVRLSIVAATSLFIHLEQISPAMATSCEGVATVNSLAVARDEGSMISACEYRDDCTLKKGSTLSFEAIVVLPSYEMHNLFVMDSKGRCFVSSDFDFPEECNAPVRVNEGCEP